MPEASNRNVFILGAGFSAPAGAPLVHDFLDRAREFYDDPASGLDDQERGRFGKVFEFRREMARSKEKISIDLDNLEQLFGLVEMSVRLEKAPPETRYHMVYLIAKTLELSLAGQRRRSFEFNSLPGSVDPRISRFVRTEASNANSVSVYMDMYQFFAALAAGLLDPADRRQPRKDTIITFNYDLVIDDALRSLDILPDYHLCVPATYSDAAPPPAVPRVSLLKLHGSANWGICTCCNQDIRVEVDKVTVSPDVFRALECRHCHKRSFEPLLVPPSWDKTEYTQVLQPVWQEAVKELALATRVCIIGYSIPEADAFFRYLLTLALAENSKLYKLIVVNLGKQAKLRYSRLLETLFRERRFEFHEQGTEMFFAQRGHRVLGRGEHIYADIRMY